MGRTRHARHHPCPRISTRRQLVGREPRPAGRSAARNNPPPPSTDLSARDDHFATRASSAFATCQSTTWTCGSSTPGMAGIVVDVDMVDIAAGRRQVVEAFVRIEVLDRQHVDGADQLALVVIGEERAGRQRGRVDEELAHAGQEVGQLDQAADGLEGRGRRRLGDVGGMSWARAGSEPASKTASATVTGFIETSPWLRLRQMRWRRTIGCGGAEKVPGNLRDAR